MKLLDIERLNNLPVAKMNYYYAYGRKSSESEDRQVASVDSQKREISKLSNSLGIEIDEWFTEAKSAKAPGRKEFNRLVKAIESRKGGSVCLVWKLNRLFRNPKDEGTIRWLLDSGKLTQIITPTKTYETSDSDFIMAVEGAQAQRFIRDLREDTKRGIDAKIEMGWKPGMAPVGYINDKHMNQGTKTISPHPIYFELMRKVFELAMTGNYSTEELRKHAKKLGIKTCYGKEISKTSMHSTLRNPFYCGRFVYAGKLHQGAHKPVLSENEYDTVQAILDGKGKPRKQTHNFPYSGLIKCGFCGYGISFENHKKKSGLEFNYARCSQKSRKKCIQPYVNTDILSKQVEDFLGTIRVTDDVVKWTEKWAQKAELQDRAYRNLHFKAIKEELDRFNNMKNNLIDKYNQDLVDEDSFKETNRRYTMEITKLANEYESRVDDWDDWTNLTVEIIGFARIAQDSWLNGTMDDKRRVLAIIGSNLTLTNKKLEITPKTAFLIIKKGMEEEKGLGESLNPKLVPNSGVEDFQSSAMGG